LSLLVSVDSERGVLSEMKKNIIKTEVMLSQLLLGGWFVT